jgi:hypothetical protein
VIANGQPVKRCRGHGGLRGRLHDRDLRLCAHWLREDGPCWSQPCWSQPPFRTRSLATGCEALAALCAGGQPCSIAHLPARRHQGQAQPRCRMLLPISRCTRVHRGIVLSKKLRRARVLLASVLLPLSTLPFSFARILCDARAWRTPCAGGGGGLV